MMKTRTCALVLAVAAGFVAAVNTSAAPVPKAGPPRLLAVSSKHGGNWDIYLVHPDTGESKNITDHKARDTDPSWSPDGRRIAFVSDRGGAREIWLMGATGDDPKQLTDKIGLPECLRWSPDGSRIAFVSRAEHTRHVVYSVDVATKKVTQVSKEDFPSREPAWSPDGKRIAYTAYPADPKNALHIVNPDGTGKADLAGKGGGMLAAWSPEGFEIAFTSRRRNDGVRLFITKSDGTRVREVEVDATPAPVSIAGPQWSPDGKVLAFPQWDGKRMQVAVVKPDGSGHAVLTEGETHAHPRWSPDGKSISFGRFYDSYGFFLDADPPDLFVADSDGKNPRELIRAYVGAEWKPR